MNRCRETMKTVEDRPRRVDDASPFVRKSLAAVLADLERSRRQIAAGEGIPAAVALRELGARYGFV